MIGKINLEGMKFYAFHGVYPEERKNGQLYRVDFSFHTEIEKGSISDSIEDTVDYTSIYKIISEEMNEASNLLEHVAVRMNKRLMETFPLIHQTELKLTKLSPPIDGSMDGVSLTIHG
jgi:dihydroneopterin aldolase